MYIIVDHNESTVFNAIMGQEVVSSIIFDKSVEIYIYNCNNPKLWSL